MEFLGERVNFWSGLTSVSPTKGCKVIGQEEISMDNEHDLEEEQERPVVADFCEEEEEKKACLTPLTLLALLGVGTVLGAILVPNFIRARARGQLTSCKSNLKNLGTAMEMYSTDWAGKYPAEIDLLTPNYLKTLPDCPATGRVTYKLQTGQVVYNEPGFDDYYFFQCAGENHTSVSVPPGYPQYDGISGLLER